ncbi:MAG: EamA family transporter [Lachnospiraceae bacterium]|nr:EamA family transporter [Lachnospiraceae bacterium]
MIKCILIYVCSVFISSVAQILLKKSTQKSHESVIKEYLNPYVITAYAIFLVSTILTVFALRKVPLSMAPVIESLGYVFVAVLGYFAVHERLEKQKIIGIVFILIGICVSCIN